MPFYMGISPGVVDGEFVASMKMMNVFSGVITWADLLKFRENDEGSVTISNPFRERSRKD